MKNVSFVFGKEKEIDDLNQARITAIDKVKGRVSLAMKNGLISTATYLHDINDLRVGMTVLVGMVNDSYFILEKVSANPKNSNGMSLLQLTTDFSNSFEFSVYISPDNLQCKLPLYNMINCFINWGDGSIFRIAEWLEGNPIHTYTSSGTYIIQVIGSYLWHHWIETAELGNQFRELKRWGGFKLGVDPGEFHSFIYMTITATDIPEILGTGLSSFTQCYSLTNIPNIENWDVSACTSFFNTFYRTPFDQDISKWNISNVTNMNGMFYGAGLSTENYEKLLVGWSSQNVKTDVVFNAGNATYHAAYASYKQILVNKGWQITDGGQI